MKTSKTDQIGITFHEITHAIINDKGYNMKEFDEEDLCCFVEANFCEIQRVVGEFLYKQGQAGKDEGKGEQQ